MMQNKLEKTGLDIKYFNLINVKESILQQLMKFIELNPRDFV